MTGDAEVQEAAADAVARFVEQIEPGAVATRFLLVVEIVGTDGQRALWVAVPADTQNQDVLGLAGHADAHARAQIAAEAQEHP